MVKLVLLRGPGPVQRVCWAAMWHLDVRYCDMRDVKDVGQQMHLQMGYRSPEWKLAGVRRRLEACSTE